LDCVIISFFTHLSGEEPLMLEGGVRLLLPIYDPSGNVEFHAHYEGVFIGPANERKRHWTRTGDFDVPVEFNEYGLRDRKAFKNVKNDSIFALGDSFTFGWGVLETERFSDVIGRGIDQPVYNLAAPNDLHGYQGLLGYAEDNGVKVKRVVLALCMENDLKVYNEEWSKSKPMHEFNFNLGLNRVKSTLERISAAYVAITTQIHQNESLREFAYKIGFIDNANESYNYNVYSEAGISSSVKKVKQIISQMDESWVVIIPARSLWLSADNSEELKVHQTVVKQLKNAGLNVIDLKPVFEAAGDPMGYHFLKNGHWNAKGHELAGKEIAARILTSD